MLEYILLSFKNICKNSCISKCHRKSIGGVAVFSNFATDHFSGNFSPDGTSLSDNGSNDKGLMSVWPPGAESIAGQTNKHTDF